MEHERKVAGLHCGEVLAELSDYFDGEMATHRREQVLAHLQGCDVCERFGGVFSAAILALRQAEIEASGEEDLAFERLRVRLGQSTHREST